MAARAVVIPWVALMGTLLGALRVDRSFGDDTVAEVPTEMVVVCDSSLASEPNIDLTGRTVYVRQSLLRQKAIDRVFDILLASLASLALALLMMWWTIRAMSKDAEHTD